MGWEAWLTLGLVGLMAVALLRNIAGPDTVLLGGLTLLMTAGVVSDRLPGPMEMVAGFGNEGLIAIAVLFVVACGLTQTGAMNLMAQPLLGRPKTVSGAQVRMMFPVAALSAFLNNTPIVAMFIPVVTDWCRKTRISPSKLFIPLSYAAILGGTCSLIGTSTNLVVHGLINDHVDTPIMESVEIGMFTIAWVGIPASLVGFAYILLASSKLLPDRRATHDQMTEGREYTIEMLVEQGSSVEGKTIEQAGLRHLPGVFLSAIERAGDRIVAVGPEQVLHGGDRLIFVGIVSSVVDLQKIRGLVPATEQVSKLTDPRPDRCLVEAVISDMCPLAGKTVREGRFRTVYNGAIIAVHRGGQRINQKIGDIVLQPGDTLLIESHPRFLEQNRNNRDFFLISAVDQSTPLRHDRAWIALTILVGMVLLVTFNYLEMVNGALLAAGLMVATGCCSSNEARAAVNWRVLLAIGSAIGIGKALETSGAADGVADAMMSALGPMGPHGMLLGVYLIAMIFNIMIGHIGAAVLVFPIAMALATAQQLDFTPFAIAIMMAASADFASPISYPTHLMVYGAGGYRFSDYVKFGLPLNLLVMAVVVVLAPIIWPF